MRKKISKNSNLHERIYQIPQQENQMHDQNHIIDNQKLNQTLKQINQCRFLTYWESQILPQKNVNFTNKNSNSQLGNQIQKNQKQNFSNQQRQSLKNAFRYICRLVFKEAINYYDVIKKTTFNQKQICLKQKNNKNKKKKDQIDFKFKYGYLFEQAQQISGERYFKEFLQRLQNIEKIIVLKYMIWFLKTKYLRYINKSINQNKGKRKDMKKQLYIRFKNNVMLPYLHQILKETQMELACNEEKI